VSLGKVEDIKYAAQFGIIRIGFPAINWVATDIESTAVVRRTGHDSQKPWVHVSKSAHHCLPPIWSGCSHIWVELDAQAKESRMRFGRVINANELGCVYLCLHE